MLKPNDLPSSTSLWWHRENLRPRINGIFKGGGAKGIMYAGALLEIRDEGYWFRAVAGSSAGAITATLIAAGLTPDELVAEVPKGLQNVHIMPLGDLVGSPLVQAEKLAEWLDQLLRNQVLRLRGVELSQPVTFKELYDASRIELYVVAVDVADRQPRVFSEKTSPHLSITDAVLASSAIPMAFSPARLEVREVPGTASVHRLMDGGVWANYPAFVFKDPSFRVYHELEELPKDSVTIGFTLDTKPAEERAQAIRFLRGMAGSYKDKGGFLPWLFRNPLLRFYFMTIVPVVVAAQAWYTIEAAGLVFLKDYANRPGVPDWLTRIAGFFDGFFSHFFWGYWSLIAFLVVMALLLAVLGATLLDSGVPAMGTLMSVGTDVPYWIGAASDDHVIRLRVPSWLGTLSFRLSGVQIAEAVADARKQTKPHLSAILSRAGK